MKKKLNVLMGTLMGVLLALSITARAQTLSGTYTIGGSSPNYTSFNAAVTALKNGVVTGPVTFKVRSGVYNEQVIIPLINGASAQYPITFVSESGNAEDVVLQSAKRGGSQVTAQAVVGFEAAAYIRWQKMSLQNTETNFANDGNASSIFFLRGSCVDIRIEHCVMRYDSLIVSPRARHIVSNYGGAGNGNTQGLFITNNTFLYGGEMITLDGYLLAGGGGGLRINRNKFMYPGWKTVQITNYNVDSVCYNHFETLPGVNVNHQALTIQSSVSDMRILGNYMLTGGYRGGILLTSCSAPNKAIVANNMLIWKYSTNTTGRTDYLLEIQSCQRLGIYYNSLLMTGASLKAYTLYIGSGGNVPSSEIEVLNNVGSSAVGQIVYYVADTRAISRSDYNCWHSSGSVLAYWGSNRANLTELKTASGMEANSMSVLPLFVSETDLHNRNPVFDGAATPISGITKDFDGDTRHTTTPDLGCDEFPALQVDLAVIDLFFPDSLGKGQEVRIGMRLHSLGKKSLKDSTVQVQYSTDGGSTWTSPESVTLSGLVNPLDTMNYLFTTKWTIPSMKAYQVCARFVASSLKSDQKASNNEFCKRACVSFSGNLSIGSSGADFPDFTEAAVLLNCGLQTGPTYLLAKTGNYTGTMNIGPVRKSNEWDLLWIGPEPGQTGPIELTASGAGLAGDHALIRLNGVKNATITGLQINNTLKNLPASGIHLTGGTDSVRIVNNKIQVDSTGTYGQVFPIVASNATSTFGEGQNSHRIRIAGNELIGGAYGIRLYGQNGNFTQGHRIIGNKIIGAYYYGIHSRFAQTDSIWSNQIELRPEGSPTARSGIVCTGHNGATTIANNVIRRATRWGIYLSNINGGQQSLLANNMVSGSFDSTASDYALWLDNVGNFLVAHNAVVTDTRNIYGTACRIDHGVNTTNIRLFNNLFVNKGPGAALVLLDSTGMGNWNNNVYYSAGQFLLVWLEEHATLADYQTFSGKDAQAMSFLPGFFGPNDLRSRDDRLNEKAFYLGAVPRDFEGDIRHPSKPDVGPDEFEPGQDLAVEAFVQPMAGVLQSNKAHAVEVRVRNVGTAEITQAKVLFSLNKVVLDSVELPMALSSGAAVLLQMKDSLHFPDSGTYTLCAWHTLNPDLDLKNDTLCRSIKVERPQGWTPELLINDLRFYPNPAAEFLILENMGNEVHEARIIDIRGKIIWAGVLGANEEQSIDLKGMSPGLYVLQFDTGQRERLILE